MAGYPSADEAEAAFYAAFEKRDLAAMMAVWTEDGEPSCVHPFGQLLVGRDAIRASWETIFTNSPIMRFRVEISQRLESPDLVTHIVHEHIEAGTQTPQSPIIATNIYRRTATGWRMVLHHASPTPRSSAAPKERTVH